MNLKIILAPDSFKGTMSSHTVCNTMKDAILSIVPDSTVVPIPVADGGEGSVDAFLEAVGGEKIDIKVTGPRFEKVDSFYGILPGNVAIIEMAAAAGLPMMGEQLDVMGATTYGVGELMDDAIARGCKKIILALGGSATNDGACGAAAALGARFFNADGAQFVPTGATLSDIQRIDCSELDVKLWGITVEAMCDIDNPLCGERGAAAVFAPQKGATATDVELLDAGLLHLAQLLEHRCKVEELAGSGAAGGMGGGSVAFFNAKLRMGIDTVLDTCSFESLLCDADLVLTGEGRLDSQSLGGKVAIGVARRAKKMGVPTVAVVGAIEDPIDAVYAEGVSAVFSINRKAQDFEKSKGNSTENLYRTMCDIIRLYRLQHMK